VRRAQRSEQAQAYRGLYNTRQWRETRRLQLMRHPLCERCLGRGYTRQATEIHHRKAHKGDWGLFLDPENLESLCASCHNSEAQQQEKRGYSKLVGPDGLPTDPMHPLNRRRKP
jgi:5-methylcytosine-specific restriction protein A